MSKGLDDIKVTTTELRILADELYLRLAPMIPASEAEAFRARLLDVGRRMRQSLEEPQAVPPDGG